MISGKRHCWWVFQRYFWGAFWAPQCHLVPACSRESKAKTPKLDKSHQARKQSRWIPAHPYTQTERNSSTHTGPLFCGCNLVRLKAAIILRVRVWKTLFGFESLLFFCNSSNMSSPRGKGKHTSTGEQTLRQQIRLYHPLSLPSVGFFPIALSFVPGDNELEKQCLFLFWSMSSGLNSIVKARFIANQSIHIWCHQKLSIASLGVKICCCFFFFFYFGVDCPFKLWLPILKNLKAHSRETNNQSL